MSATRYRRFLKLCEEWPRDESKKARDLGTFLRQRVAATFREGESTQFPRVRDTSFTGVTVEECRVLLSEKKGLWKTLMQRFSSKPPEDTIYSG
uniref:Mitochondrial nucleoid factor 1 n=1 Tax=Periophthalmus magnuspinnatus TaxID=409849 RepID=A0A3B4A678_9GOBI